MKFHNTGCALHQWREASVDAARSQAACGVAIYRWQHSSLVWAVLRWRSEAQKTMEMGVALRGWARLGLGKGFRTWVSRMAEWLDEEQLVRRMVAHWCMMAAGRALQQLRWVVASALEEERLLAQSVFVWRHQSLLGSVMWWREHTAEYQTAVGAMNVWQHASVASAMRTWLAWGAWSAGGKWRLFIF